MDNLLPWLFLKHVPGIGNHLFKRLIEHFGSPQRIFQVTPPELMAVEGISKHLAAAILNYKAPEWIATELDRVHQKGYTVVTLADTSYPLLLREIPDPPPLLYVCGNLAVAKKNIAVVGSRNATEYGISAAQKLCADLTAFDITIVSGMALGIDSAAHQGALAGRGKTVAVLGSGFNKIYPAENRGLFQRISEAGAVISEFALDTEPEAHNFPVRNRIISGMSMGTIVVEASRKSGSLITARLAAEQNREVFAVPGSIHSFKSSGAHRLIKQGAKLVENAQDVLEELTVYMDQASETADPNVEPSVEKSGLLLPDELALYEILSPYPEHIDAIGRKAKLEPGKLLSLLLQLELKGMVQQLPGKRFVTLEPNLEGPAKNLC